MSEPPGFSFAQLGGLGNGGWRGALRIAQRQVPLRGEGLCELGGRLPAKSGMGAFRVIVFAPGDQRDAGMVQGREQGLVQEFVPQAAVEALDKGVLGRLAWPDVMPVKLAGIDELQDRVRGELGPVVTAIVWDLPRASNSVASSRATRAPDSEVSAIRELCRNLGDAS